MLEITATDLLDISDVTNLMGTFSNCRSITSIPQIINWDVSNVTNMVGMFNYALL